MSRKLGIVRDMNRFECVIRNYYEQQQQLGEIGKNIRQKGGPVLFAEGKRKREKGKQKEIPLLREGMQPEKKRGKQKVVDEDDVPSGVTLHGEPVSLRQYRYWNRQAKRVADQIQFFERGTTIDEPTNTEFSGKNRLHITRGSGREVWLQPQGVLSELSLFFSKGPDGVLLVIDAHKLIGLGMYDVEAILSQKTKRGIDEQFEWEDRQRSYWMTQHGYTWSMAEQKIEAIWEKHKHDPLWLMLSVHEAHFVFYDQTKFSQYLDAVVSITYLSARKRRRTEYFHLANLENIKRVLRKRKKQHTEREKKTRIYDIPYLETLIQILKEKLELREEETGKISYGKRQRIDDFERLVQLMKKTGRVKILLDEVNALLEVVDKDKKREEAEKENVATTQPVRDGYFTRLVPSRPSSRMQQKEPVSYFVALLQMGKSDAKERGNGVIPEDEKKKFVVLEKTVNVIKEMDKKEFTFAEVDNIAMVVAEKIEEEEEEEQGTSMEIGRSMSWKCRPIGNMAVLFAEAKRKRGKKGKKSAREPEKKRSKRDTSGVLAKVTIDGKPVSLRQVRLWNRQARAIADQFRYFQRGTSILEVTSTEFVGGAARIHVSTSGGREIWIEAIERQYVLDEGGGNAEFFWKQAGTYGVKLTIDAYKLIGMGMYETKEIYSQDETETIWAYKQRGGPLDIKADLALEKELRLRNIWKKNKRDPLWLIDSLGEAHFVFYDQIPFSAYLNAIVSITYTDKKDIVQTVPFSEATANEILKILKEPPSIDGNRVSAAQYRAWNQQAAWIADQVQYFLRGTTIDEATNTEFTSERRVHITRKSGKEIWIQPEGVLSNFDDFYTAKPDGVLLTIDAHKLVGLGMYDVEAILSQKHKRGIDDYRSWVKEQEDYWMYQHDYSYQKAKEHRKAAWNKHKRDPLWLMLAVHEAHFVFYDHVKFSQYLDAIVQITYKGEDGMERTEYFRQANLAEIKRILKNKRWTQERKFIRPISHYEDLVLRRKQNMKESDDIPEEEEEEEEGTSMEIGAHNQWKYTPIGNLATSPFLMIEGKRKKEKEKVPQPLEPELKRGRTSLTINGKPVSNQQAESWRRQTIVIATEVRHFLRGTSIFEVMSTEFTNKGRLHVTRDSGKEIWMQPIGVSSIARHFYKNLVGQYGVLLVIDPHKLIGLGMYDVEAILKQAGKHGIDEYSQWARQQYFYWEGKGLSEDEIEYKLDTVWDENKHKPLWLMLAVHEAHFVFYDHVKFSDYLKAIVEITYADASGTEHTENFKDADLNKILAILEEKVPDPLHPVSFFEKKLKRLKQYAREEWGKDINIPNLMKQDIENMENVIRYLKSKSDHMCFTYVDYTNVSRKLGEAMPNPAYPLASLERRVLLERQRVREKWGRRHVPYNVNQQMDILKRTIRIMREERGKPTFHWSTFMKIQFYVKLDVEQGKPVSYYENSLRERIAYENEEWNGNMPGSVKEELELLSEAIEKMRESEYDTFTGGDLSRIINKLKKKKMLKEEEEEEESSSVDEEDLGWDLKFVDSGEEEDEEEEGQGTSMEIGSHMSERLWLI